MISHLMVGSNDLARSRTFYDAVLGAIGVGPSDPAAPVAIYHAPGAPAFVVTRPRDGQPATCGNGGTIGFNARSVAQVDAFHQAGLAHGGTDEGAPGVRQGHPMKFYGAYLRDPDGNKICAFAPNDRAGE